MLSWSFQRWPRLARPPAGPPVLGAVRARGSRPQTSGSARAFPAVAWPSFCRALGHLVSARDGLRPECLPMAGRQARRSCVPPAPPRPATGGRPGPHAPSAPPGGSPAGGVGAVMPHTGLGDEAPRKPSCSLLIAAVKNDHTRGGLNPQESSEDRACAGPQSGRAGPAPAGRSRGEGRPTRPSVRDAGVPCLVIASQQGRHSNLCHISS